MKKKILVVDDEMDIRIFISTLAETNGYKSFVAKDGEEGLQMVKVHKPDLIILDVMMPRESGLKLYRELRSDNTTKLIPIIMVSAVSRKTFLHSIKELERYHGVSLSEPEAYIEKPPEAEELITLISKHCPA
ncbi:MAG: response regulator [Deltaproteobacteria bacterium]|nr:response regulator [Deltaproteobacteria bacterium]